MVRIVDELLQSLTQMLLMPFEAVAAWTRDVLAAWRFEVELLTDVGPGDMP